MLDVRMGTRITQVDAFTGRPFAGNPAAICVLPAPADPDWMQHVALEMNLSETAFLFPRDGGTQAGFDLRWFTPTVEVDLCGHATLAAAHVLWEEGHLAAGQPARFHTRSGLLTAGRNGEWIELDFPSLPPSPTVAPSGLEEALGTSSRYVAKSRYDYLLEIDSDAAVRGLRPDFTALREIDARGIIVTARAADASFDFVSRFFAPAAGIDEDPVTGSAHCTLAPFWEARLGKKEMLGYQASARGGTVKVHVAGDRVILGGKAITVLRGELV
jgi:PhzF family phenazine biosynthesis protein